MSWQLLASIGAVGIPCGYIGYTIGCLVTRHQFYDAFKDLQTEVCALSIKVHGRLYEEAKRHRRERPRRAA